MYLTEDVLAFYIMNSKGYYVFKEFIKEFGNKNISYVVCSKDANIQKDYYKEIKLISKNNNIIFFNRNDEYVKIENFFEGYKISVGWRWIIKNSNNLIVFHDSLLPSYRGFSPLVNSLINGEKNIGVTALFASSEYDKGDIIMQKSIKINYPCKISEVIEQIEPLYFKLLKDIYSLILKNKKILSKKQDENKASYSLWLDDEDYFIDWKNWDAEKIKRFVDAVGYPYDNAKSYLNGNIIKLIDVTVTNDIKVEHRERHIGKVVFMKNDQAIIVCKKGLIHLLDSKNLDDTNVSLNFRSRFK